MAFQPSDIADRATFEAIFRALDRSSWDVIGPAEPRALVIPIRDEQGVAIGGLWGHTTFRWLHVEMVFVPEAMRDRGIGSMLMLAAEREAGSRGCIGIYLDAFSFQAAPFYEKIGYSAYGVLDNFPPGHQRLFFQKRLEPKRGSPGDGNDQRDRQAVEA